MLLIIFLTLFFIMNMIIFFPTIVKISKRRLAFNNLIALLVPEKISEQLRKQNAIDEWINYCKHFSNIFVWKQAIKF